MAKRRPKKKKGFLSKIKDTLKADLAADGMGSAHQDDNVDLDSGIIKVEEADPSKAIATSDVLRAGEEDEGDSLYQGQEKGVVYVLDLQPFYKAIGTTADEKLGRSLIQFSENLLARMLKGGGTYTCHENEKFLFRLDKSDAEGWLMASKIVNDLGTHFLRDGFKPEEILPEALSMVDLADAMDENGEIDPAKALTAQRNIPKKLIEQTSKWGRSGNIWAMATRTRSSSPNGKRIRMNTAPSTTRCNAAPSDGERNRILRQRRTGVPPCMAGVIRMTPVKPFGSRS